MVRKIIQIDEEKCNGCGACASACHEGAIAMVNGKARLIRDDYCDGLGDCLPTCPVDAIKMVEREAVPYDEAAVQARIARAKADSPSPADPPPLACGCPGTMAKKLGAIEREEETADATVPASAPRSRLAQWPVQIKLVPVRAPYFDGAKLLIAADCSAFSYAGFHERFMKGHITLMGCPKLDMVDYSEKLTAIIRENDIKSVTVVRMEVPCCGGIEMAVKTALMNSGKFIPWQVVTLSTDGRILD